MRQSSGIEPTAARIEGLQEAVGLLDALTKSVGTTPWISALEARLQGADGSKVRTVVDRDGIGRETLDAALLLKRVSGR